MQLISHYWPKSAIAHSEELAPNFLWIESDAGEYKYIKQNLALLENFAVIFTTTCFSGSSKYLSLKNLIEKNHFKLLSHWCQKDNSGQAISVRNDIYGSAINGLNFSNFTSHRPICESSPTDF